MVLLLALIFRPLGPVGALIDKRFSGSNSSAELAGHNLRVTRPFPRCRSSAHENWPCATGQQPEGVVQRSRERSAPMAPAAAELSLAGKAGHILWFDFSGANVRTGPLQPLTLFQNAATQLVEPAIRTYRSIFPARTTARRAFSTFVSLTRAARTCPWMRLAENSSSDIT